ncbi:DNA replication/repair protein RecF [Aliidiomarina minuta]|uniref:DNA replication and repair protein RecF n=1 Tax=Aliidiomarina minuta TaxID=880057 RepID=A0A432W9Z3_9GAMM|nr:DNA replication/repair protein RecF [Aliidiomarina minuta]RUO26977.1 DNA replication/repair protein RecF [Aliidiomarina minuta]
MRFERLNIEHFRNFSGAQLEMAPQVNIICGPNGSGKTSFLEAVYCLGFGRSFRTHQIRQLVKDEQDAFTLFAQLQSDSDEPETHKIGYRRFRNGDTQIKVDGDKAAKFASLARLVPVQLITPESVELITGGPKLRRQFMDWGLFHVEQSFHSAWSGYVRLLKQRNSLLRQGQYEKQGGAYWDEQLAASGELVAAFRQSYVEGLNALLNEYCHRFLPQYDFKFKLNHGWLREEHSLQQALQQRLEQDKKQLFTGVGPHKAEWQIKADGVDARERLSRGQLKLLVSALRLVQGRDYQSHRGQACVFLVDDLPAELDEFNQRELCNALIDSGSQVFITAIDEKKITPHFSDTDNRLFHVEHGTI